MKCISVAIFKGYSERPRSENGGSGRPQRTEQQPQNEQPATNNTAVGNDDADLAL